MNAINDSLSSTSASSHPAARGSLWPGWKPPHRRLLTEAEPFQQVGLSEDRDAMKE